MSKLFILITSFIIILVSCKSKKTEKTDIVQSDFNFASAQLSYAMVEVDKGITEEPEESKEKREKRGHSL